MLIKIPRHKVRQFSISCCRMRRKPKQERDPSKRNLQGEDLIERLRRRENDLVRQKPYKESVAQVVRAFQLEIEEEDGRRNDIQGELMQRELAERQQALKNLAILSKSNEELKLLREKQNLVEEEKMRILEKEMKLMFEKKKEERKEKNREIVLRLIDEQKSFVTRENLDEKIEVALKNPMNYNFALKSDGEKIISTSPPGNLNGWKGANPSAYALGGVQQGGAQWNYIFRKQMTNDK